MPSFFALLRMAELDQMTILDGVKQSGIHGLLAFFVLAGAVGALVAGAADRRQRLLLVALTLAVIGSAIGWVGAFAGYIEACRVVGASKSRPKQSELVQGANGMAWTALVPTAGALPIILVAVVGLGLTRREKDPTNPADPASA